MSHQILSGGPPETSSTGVGPPRKPFMRIRNESELLTPDQIVAIEAEKNATFVCEACIKVGSSWENKPSAIFYCPTPHPVSHSHYFAVTRDILGSYVVTNGQSAADVIIIGIIAQNGDIIYSRYCHDCRTSEDGTASIDGGRDYVKINLKGNYLGDRVRLQIVEDKLVCLDF